MANVGRYFDVQVKCIDAKYITDFQVIQIVYLLIALYHDVASLLSLRLHWFPYVRNYVFSTLVLPCTLFTTVTFWIIHYINKDYIIPSELIVPSWLNHMVHTNPAIVLLTEFLLYRNSLPDKKCAAFGLGFVLLLYNFV